MKEPKKPKKPPSPDSSAKAQSMQADDGGFGPLKKHLVAILKRARTSMGAKRS
ncbi:MAG TPA: hypothetical protein VFY72_13050 [Beijerinckiaceae bacterium]|nr:hypothetical protein [Beijerinckiaceae bacterium]